MPRSPHLGWRPLFRRRCLPADANWAVKCDDEDEIGLLNC